MTEQDTGQSRGAKKSGGAAQDVVTIKKYANRRLYNTSTSSYVTLDYLSDMVKNGQDFVVFDAKSGDDITRSVLTQIIFEEESKGQNLLPIQFLRQLIQFYGDSLQSFVPSYLEMSMDAFARNQESIREQMRGAFGASPGYSMFEEASRKNMAMFQQAMKIFSPMGYAAQAPPRTGNAPAGEPGAGVAGDDNANGEIQQLRAELAALKRQMAQRDSE